MGVNGGPRRIRREPLRLTRSVTEMTIRVRSTLLLLIVTGISAPAWAQEIVERLPDIQALPPFDISAGIDIVWGNPELRFAVTTANRGEGVLEFHGGETGRGKQNIYQRVYLSDGGYYDRRVGSYVWHPEHNHIHVEDYAEYVLQALNAPGNSRRTGQKTSFCIMDTDRIDSSASNQPTYTTCDATVQGMSVGWGDTYGAHLAGQEIDLTDLADGDYSLTIVADPRNRIDEMIEDNNSSCVLLRIAGMPTNPAVSVLDASGCAGGVSDTPGGEVTIFGIDPAQGRIGELVPITITGAGFYSGISVSFDGGSGAKLSVSDITVVGESEIRAILTISKRGNLRNGSSVWDLQVGSAVLSGAFVVVP